MSSEKQRLFLFMMLSFASYFAIEYALDKSGLAPRPKPRAVANKAADAKAGLIKEKEKGAAANGLAKAGEAGKKDGEAGKDAKAGARPGVLDARDDASKVVVDARRLPFDALKLGAATGQGADGYRLEATLDQTGAGVMSLTSSKYEAEFEPGQAKHRPLHILPMPSE